MIEGMDEFNTKLGQLTSINLLDHRTFNSDDIILLLILGYTMF